MMDLFLLISWIVEIISQCIQTSKLHVVHLKYIQSLFINYTSIKLKRDTEEEKLYGHKLEFNLLFMSGNITLLLVFFFQPFKTAKTIFSSQATQVIITQVISTHRIQFANSCASINIVKYAALILVLHHKLNLLKVYFCTNILSSQTINSFLDRTFLKIQPSH